MSDLRVDDALDLVRVTMTHTDTAHLKAPPHHRLRRSSFEGYITPALEVEVPAEPEAVSRS